jgi:hypothetical protein
MLSAEEQAFETWWVAQHPTEYQQSHGRARTGIPTYVWAKKAWLAHAEAQAAEIARLRADNEGLQQSLEIAIRVAHARAALAGEGD